MLASRKVNHCAGSERLGSPLANQSILLDLPRKSKSSAGGQCSSRSQSWSGGGRFYRIYHLQRCIPYTHFTPLRQIAENYLSSVCNNHNTCSPVPCEEGSIYEENVFFIYAQLTSHIQFFIWLVILGLDPRNFPICSQSQHSTSTFPDTTQKTQQKEPAFPQARYHEYISSRN